ncbi:MAG: methyltransferase [Gemmatimonadota bacterium]|nr:methyltransferase [Gemmatimonadota bacterium]
MSQVRRKIQIGYPRNSRDREISALLAAASVESHERVLDLGMAGRPIGLELDAAGLHFVSFDLRAVRICEDAIRRGSLYNACAWLEVSPAVLTGTRFDVVLFAPARWESKARVFELIDAAFEKMTIQGRFLLAGRRNAGVESYRNRLKAVFGRVETVTSKSGFRVYRSNKRAPATGAHPVDAKHVFEVADLPGGPFTFEAAAGVFSSRGLDAGTRILIETAEVRPGDRVLDLGCGYGAIGIAAAKQAREVQLLDTSLLAVRFTRRNIVRNGLANARVGLSDGFEAVAGRVFDLILCNAPTHDGAATARRIVQGAAMHLRSKGRLTVVAMRPGMYLKQMKRAFDTVDRLESRQAYTVLCARDAKSAIPAA